MWLLKFRVHKRSPELRHPLRSHRTAIARNLTFVSTASNALRESVTVQSDEMHHLAEAYQQGERAKHDAE